MEADTKPQPVGPRAAALSVVATLVVALTGCATAVERAVERAVEPVYRTAALSAGVSVVQDVPYVTGTGAHPEKHRLDLYVPEERAARGATPAIVFVHGGSLLRGDKDLEVAGLDFYGNVGRFYSGRGIEVAVVNYRLQPEVTWRDQVEDVARALRWVLEDRDQRGLEGEVYLVGHSAGAWLASRVALDGDLRDRHRIGHGALAGLVSISGSGFEMTDEVTWEMYDKEDWWAERFAVAEPGLDWHRAASVTPLVPTCGCGAGSPASAAVAPLRVLLIHSNQELPALGRQNRLFGDALARAGVPHRIITVSSESHRRTVMALSHPDKIVAREVLAFVQSGRIDLGPFGREQVLGSLGSTR